MNSIEEAIQYLAVVEGLTIEEAKLSYQARKKLPSSAFCGPDRSYPAHDAARVRNAFARLSQFGHRLKPAVRARILGCLKRRAKRFNVEHEETIQYAIKSIETSDDFKKQIINWFEKKEELV